jgi:hypothetical protein
LRAWIVAATAALALAGCGSDRQLDSGTAAKLHRDVAAVRAAAQAGDRAAGLSALDRLAADVDGAQLADDDARTLRTSIARARRTFARTVAAPTPTPTATPTPTPTPPPPKEEKHGKGEGKGNKHDEEGGD